MAVARKGHILGRCKDRVRGDLGLCVLPRIEYVPFWSLLAQHSRVQNWLPASRDHAHTNMPPRSMA